MDADDYLSVITTDALAKRLVRLLATEADRAYAFGRGCDARLAGVPFVANPFRADGSGLRKAWSMGWHDVDKNWGRLAARGVCPLPPVGKR